MVSVLKPGQAEVTGKSKGCLEISAIVALTCNLDTTNGSEAAPATPEACPPLRAVL